MLQRADEHGVVSVADQLRDAERFLRVLRVYSLERRRVPMLELPLEGELKIDARGDRERSSSRDEVINSNRSEVLVEEHASGIASFRPAEHHRIRIIGRQRGRLLVTTSSRRDGKRAQSARRRQVRKRLLMPFRQLALRASRRSRDPQMQTTADPALLASVDVVAVGAGLWPALPEGHPAAFLCGLRVSACSA